MKKYWHCDTITAFSEEAFTEGYCKWAKEKGYHASATKAKSIYLLAKSGIPILSSSAASIKMLTLEVVRVLAEINKTPSNILTKMQELSASLPEYETVLAMQGVGVVLAPRLITEIGDVRRFQYGSALVAYAGIDAAYPSVVLHFFAKQVMK